MTCTPTALMILSLCILVYMYMCMILHDVMRNDVMNLLNIPTWGWYLLPVIVKLILLNCKRSSIN